MSEHDSLGNEPSNDHEEYTPDTDVNFRVVAIGVLATIGVTVLAVILMWPLVEGFLALNERQDPPPSPLAEANERSVPPGPKLQADPPKELQELRADEAAVLDSYGWVDRSAGVARIPLARAMALVIDEGLPVVANPDPNAAGGQR